MKIKNLTLFITLFVLYNTSLKSFAQERMVTDMAGRQISIPDSVERIACIGRGSLRLVCYLHAANRVVGVEFPERKKTDHVRPYLLAYPFLKTLSSIGYGAAGDPELLLKVAPQVIFYADGKTGAVNSLQDKTGIPVVNIRPGNLLEHINDFNASMQLVSQILGCQSRCDSLLAFVDSQLHEISVIKQNFNFNVSAYIGGLVFKGMHGIGSTQVNFTPFQLLGIKNVAKNIKANPDVPVQINIEQLLLWGPDYLFVDMTLAESGRNDLDKFGASEWDIHLLAPSRLYGENFEITLLNTFKVAQTISGSDMDYDKKCDEILTMFLNTTAAQAFKTLYISNK